ncbi:FAD-dependent oxidoreductase, partial [Sphingomonas sp.]|uniref:FAD-dependent oxidoreductase n=1 Tax=Sphingomonas sp. TaxID=28214 RepID=UPI00286DD7CE
IHSRDSLRAERILQQRLFAHPNVSVLWNKEVREFVDGGGTAGLVALDLVDTVTGEQSRLDVEGGFVAIGHHPATELFRGHLDLDDDGYIAVEEALYMTNHTHDVTLIHRRDSLRAEKILQDRLFANPHIKVIWNSEVAAFVGAGDPEVLAGLDLKDTRTGDIRRLEVEGAFVAIGHSPATELFAGKLTLDGDGYIEAEPGSTRTSVPGVFACGDVMDKIYRQAVTAAGTGCMAALDAEKFLAAEEYAAIAAE